MPIRNLLQDVRKKRGLSAADLAKRVGVSRQTIYAIEDGTFVPNTTISLRLAHTLDVTVEQLFELEEERGHESLGAELLAGEADGIETGQLVRLCRVNNRLVAAPVPSFAAFLPGADGIVSESVGARVSVSPAVDGPQKYNRLLLAGCDPALSLLTEMLHYPGMEIVAVPGSSRCALNWLKQGRVHIAGSHLLDHATGDYNVPFVKQLFPRGGVQVVTFAAWEQGLVVARGNPKSVKAVSDLANRHVTVVNREKGSGSRDLLDKELRKAGIPAPSIAGYKSCANGHLAAAYAVAAGIADCCVATRSAARRFGLDFVPLALERFDLSFSKASRELPAANALLDLLTHSILRRKLNTLAGYDTAHTGEVLS